MISTESDTSDGSQTSQTSAPSQPVFDESFEFCGDISEVASFPMGFDSSCPGYYAGNDVGGYMGVNSFVLLGESVAVLNNLTKFSADNEKSVKFFSLSWAFGREPERTVNYSVKDGYEAVAQAVSGSVLAVLCENTDKTGFYVTYLCKSFEDTPSSDIFFRRDFSRMSVDADGGVTIAFDGGEVVFSDGAWGFG